MAQVEEDWDGFILIGCAVVGAFAAGFVVISLRVWFYRLRRPDSVFPQEDRGWLGGLLYDYDEAQRRSRPVADAAWSLLMLAAMGVTVLLLASGVFSIVEGQ